MADSAGPSTMKRVAEEIVLDDSEEGELIVHSAVLLPLGGLPRRHDNISILQRRTSPTTPLTW